MVIRAKRIGVQSKYLLFDSWFAMPSVIASLRQHMDIISMLKNHPNGYYAYNGKQLRLSDLYSKLKKRRGKAQVKASVIVTLPDGKKAKNIFVSCDKKRGWVALLSARIDVTDEDMIRLYLKRWDIESGFKEIKQEIGSSKAHVRNSESVLNHLKFCMMATTLTWIYADRLENVPNRRHKIRGRAGFAFSDVRRIIAEEALSSDFYRICPMPDQTPQNSFVKTLLRMVA
ncbi:MAG: hypothetical protein CSA22_06055 [Deltaproteobacteria bacterium]|nr:MAG: hypothetical protein CSA22_06055 [Deltaproteobacteria bacterium]